MKPQKIITISGTSTRDIISNGQNYNLKFIISNYSSEGPQIFLDDIYHNENEYPYLIKKFDSKEFGFKKLNFKVFEIDYKLFNEIYQ